jgi:hypothetical protein
LKEAAGAAGYGAGIGIPECGPTWIARPAARERRRHRRSWWRVRE